MTSSMHLSNVRVWDGDPNHDAVARDIFVDGGRFCEALLDCEQHDGCDWIALPGLIDAHMHLDKTLWGLPWRPHTAGKTLEEKIANERAARSDLNADTYTQACALIREASRNGTTRLRSHIDVDPEIGLTHVAAVLKARDACRNIMDIELVAFPQSGIVRSPGTAALLEQAIEMGVDHVGGIDPKVIDGDAVQHIQTIFEIAARTGAGVDIHHHEEGDAGADTLELILDRIPEFGLEGRVSLSHAFCIGMVDESRREQLLAKIANVDAAVITHAPGYKDFPPVDALGSFGIRFCAGSDNVRDVWSPYGTADMIERAMLIGYRSNFRRDDEIRTALRACTIGGAEVMNRESWGFQTGASADFLLVDASTVAEAVVMRPSERIVFKNGKLVSGKLPPAIGQK